MNIVERYQEHIDQAISLSKIDAYRTHTDIFIHLGLIFDALDKRLTLFSPQIFALQNKVQKPSNIIEDGQETSRIIEGLKTENKILQSRLNTIITANTRLQKFHIHKDQEIGQQSIYEVVGEYQLKYIKLQNEHHKIDQECSNYRKLASENIGLQIPKLSISPIIKSVLNKRGISVCENRLIKTGRIQ
ncbi:hypothetical protein SS50377_25901 [Spironucleus salmonicida]|uniref:Uncharacterized protein n=1 Tax=Spironucleus salmonicida TaxID=348837 RepID=V6M279_9EUKA|nr:hypothetical protein SS50377_25901 [Spironucleus salmonicida]|eukprot:EST47324.1 Hypothetical protein SS50377_12592 [Spironucleus salmonicida]